MEVIGVRLSLFLECDLRLGTDLVDANTLMRTQVEELDRFLRCRICGTKIKQSGHMRRHMREVHLKAWKYRCPCDRWYNNRSSLYQHVTKYHGELKRRGGALNLDDFLVS